MWQWINDKNVFKSFRFLTENWKGFHYNPLFAIVLTPLHSSRLNIHPQFNYSYIVCTSCREIVRILAFCMEWMVRKDMRKDILICKQNSASHILCVHLGKSFNMSIKSSYSWNGISREEALKEIVLFKTSTNFNFFFRIYEQI